MKTSLGHMPGNTWRFDQSVAECFEDMLSRSIPGFEELNCRLRHIFDVYLKPGDSVIDLGCSTGRILGLFPDVVSSIKYLGIDSSPEMLAQARIGLRSADEDFGISVSFLRHDLSLGLPSELVTDSAYPHPRMFLAILTLQFLKYDDRRRLIGAVADQMRRHELFVVVEKTHMGPAIETLYEEHKLSQGYSANEIARKKASLSGVMNPLSPAGNEDLFYDLNLRYSRFWQSLQFVGWIVYK